MKAAGLGDGASFELPMTQAELADALALTAIHLNRRLKVLREESLIAYDKRAVKILDFLAYHGLVRPMFRGGKYIGWRQRPDTSAGLKLIARFDRLAARTAL